MSAIEQQIVNPLQLR